MIRASNSAQFPMEGDQELPSLRRMKIKRVLARDAGLWGVE
jgi:hypothetical protein